MCGEFGEVIGLVINFLAFVSPLCAFRDTSTYSKNLQILTKNVKNCVIFEDPTLGKFIS